MKNSKIEWCDHTFNPWIGCTKVSPGCANCYAERDFDLRKHLVKWGKGQPRHRTSAAYWKQPIKWDRDAEIDRLRWAEKGDAMPPRPRVFCASHADWLDDEVPIEWLADLLDLIRRTPHLDWLLLTKRPEKWRDRLCAAMVFKDEESRRRGDKYRSEVAHFIGSWIEATAPHRGRAEIPSNIWIGTTVEDHQRADERIPAVVEIPAKVRFLSCEPLLGPVLLTKYYARSIGGKNGSVGHQYIIPPGIHWVICGGESGPKARPMNPDWARALRDQCKASGVPFLFKQWGGVRKKEAGRLLDGVEHNGSPKA